ncbi:MAG TPA: ABC transporter substrate-binding protein, partial [Ardenticatenaceae bacterium]|nr:ABC transporter substrate-binding protein [Ardenticatenaceae bacterium]
MSRRIWPVLLLVAMLFAGCSRQAPQPAAPTAQQAATEAPAVEAPAAEQEATEAPAAEGEETDAGEAISGAVLRYPIDTDPDTLDPWRTTTVASRRILVNIYEGLTQFDPETSEVAPLLAESWEISQDGKTYTFHLREGVQFQQVDGVTYEDREMTADDVVWSWLRYLSNDTEVSEHPEYLSGVEGAEAYLEGEADGVSGIQVVDDYTLEVTLAEPSHRFLADLVNAYVVPREAFEALGDE